MIEKILEIDENLWQDIQGKRLAGAAVEVQKARGVTVKARTVRENTVEVQEAAMEARAAREAAIVQVTVEEFIKKAVEDVKEAQDIHTHEEETREEISRSQPESFCFWR